MSPKTASILTAFGLSLLFFVSACWVMPVQEVAQQAVALVLLAMGTLVMLCVVALVVLVLAQLVFVVALVVVTGVPEGLALTKSIYQAGAHSMRGWLVARFPRQSAQLPLF